MGRKRREFLICCLVAGLSLCGVWKTAAAQAPTSTPPPPPMMDFQDRLAPPPTEYPPTQAGQGAQLYYQICMVCHGDRGQGLTEEWRSVLDPPDRDCWQSGCHSPRHPPDGFVFPKAVPAVIGPAMPARFKTALDLYEFLKAKMPWQAPGSRTDEEYWQLTAFLLRLNEVKSPYAALTPENATLVLFRPGDQAASPPARRSMDPILALAVVFIGILLVILLVKYLSANLIRKGH